MTAELTVLIGFDTDLAAEATRTSHRVRSLLNGLGAGHNEPPVLEPQTGSCARAREGHPREAQKNCPSSQAQEISREMT